jgi:hypothetical protein
LAELSIFFKNRRIPNNNSDGTSMSLDTSLNIKKPAKKIRSAFVKKQKKSFDLSKQTTVVTFFSITGIEYIGNADFARILKSWSSTGTNRYRMFVFKFFNIILGINTRTSHFGTNGTRCCCFCAKSGRQDTDETFSHLFLMCPPLPHGMMNLLRTILYRNSRWLTPTEKNSSF